MEAVALRKRVGNNETGPSALPLRAGATNH
jgi:hypothetical protein